ncbi:hypothetical protein AAMO2058_000104000 [Amorphochlora amoebiformis]|mmetsp:Transcript_10497/g.16608  ORF Transcript_10497/g.16608 Transcript_10497/m.16608 type:complete len:100 (-) Transcript_10497:54-353(-)
MGRQSALCNKRTKNPWKDGRRIRQQRRKALGLGVHKKFTKKISKKKAKKIMQRIALEAKDIERSLEEKGFDVESMVKIETKLRKTKSKAPKGVSMEIAS